MKTTLLALAALAALGSTAAGASPGTDGTAGIVVAKANDGSFHAECAFVRGPKGEVRFDGKQTGVAGQTSITCSVSAGGRTLYAYGNNSASGSGMLPAGPVEVCVRASVVRFVDSSHADGCRTW